MMTQAVSEIYSQALKNLPAPQRLELASLLLESIPPQAVVDYSEAWSDEDIREFSAHCLNRLGGDVNGNG